MFKNMLQILGLVSSLVLLSVDTVMAGQALSWNLSRDMMNDISINPAGVWAFMYNNTGVHSPAYYSLLPRYTVNPPGFPGNSWDTYVAEEGGISIPTENFNWTSGGIQITSLKGVTHVHPGFNGNKPILRWTSPITGIISILGRVSDADSTCGDGISWSLEKGTKIVRSGAVNGNGAVFSVPRLSVSKGTALYFIIGMGSNYYCDTTNLDMIITSQQ